MFEKIVLNRSSDGPAITTGELAEALLFYQNVHITLDYGSLSGLIREIGMQNLMVLLSRPNISAVYSDETLATRTNTFNGIDHYSFIAFTLKGSEGGTELNTRKKRVQYILERQGVDKKKAKRQAERFRSCVPARLLSSDYYIHGGVIESAKEELLSTKFVESAMKLVAADNIVGEFDPSKLIFTTVPSSQGFQIEHNLDFKRINKHRKAVDKNLDDVTPAHFVNSLLSAKSDAILAAHYGGEFYTSGLNSNIIQLKQIELLKRAGIERQEIEEFSSIVTSNLPRLSEIINAKERSFDEFLKLLDKADKFKEWARGVNPDEKLVKEYLQSVSSVGWINKIPSKSLRYVLGATIGAIDSGSGLVASAADSFLLDKLFGGWRPSHFVNHQLRPFLDGED